MPFDGSKYHFHLTIEMGKLAGTNPFRQYYDSLKDPRVDMLFEAKELGVFFYATEQHHPGSFVTYRTIALTGAETRLYPA